MIRKNSEFMTMSLDDIIARKKAKTSTPAPTAVKKPGGTQIGGDEANAESAVRPVQVTIPPGNPFKKTSTPTFRGRHDSFRNGWNTSRGNQHAARKSFPYAYERGNGEHYSSFNHGHRSAPVCNKQCCTPPPPPMTCNHHGCCPSSSGQSNSRAVHQHHVASNSCAAAAEPGSCSCAAAPVVDSIGCGCGNVCSRNPPRPPPPVNHHCYCQSSYVNPMTSCCSLGTAHHYRCVPPPQHKNNSFGRHGKNGRGRGAAQNWRY